MTPMLDLSFDPRVTISRDHETPARPWTVKFLCCLAKNFHSRHETVARYIADGHVCLTRYPIG